MALSSFFCGGAWIRTRDKDFGDPYDTTSPRPRVLDFAPLPIYF